MKQQRVCATDTALPADAPKLTFGERVMNLPEGARQIFFKELSRMEAEARA
ncbi:hypothetical protein Q4560_05830 [Celeribacter halophilus]|jgi:hypothetical protein|uniref:hypothetical protein n=1 Tax=Celeribacter halophilus TaxID=576117 RepID=UPI0026E18947|nr:hypothetical protein [Celeribacter halophilus]MDO6722776.1 hypothetical protein [Celeribacter halophilus]